jgi:hypothetical protein
MAQGYNRLAVVRIGSLLRSPFSFLFAKSGKEERVATYVIREHDRGRSLAEILDDPYVRNRCTPQETARLLDRPDLVRALGGDVVESAKQTLPAA